MYQADTLEVTLESGSLIHQISGEDDDSRGSRALCVFPKKHSYFVILTLLRAFRLHSTPELVHHDNGGEYDKEVVSRLLQMLDIDYIRFRNESKGQWARYGETALAVLKDAKAKPLTDEEREKVIRERYCENVERNVKQNGNVKCEGKWYHVGRAMSGETVEVTITLRGVEVWHSGAFIKRWN